MKKYQSFQFTWLILLALPIMIWVYYLYFYQLGNNPIPLVPMLLLEGFFLLLFLLFYGLKITLTDDLLKLRYGIGIINVKIQLEDIKSTKIVRNPWYYGLGIRIIPGGRLYNAHGLNAVELELKNKNSFIRVGSPECEVLKREIDMRLKA